jgi:hypothetical protein
VSDENTRAIQSAITGDQPRLRPGPGRYFRKLTVRDVESFAGIFRKLTNTLRRRKFRNNTAQRRIRFPGLALPRIEIQRTIAAALRQFTVARSALKKQPVKGIQVICPGNSTGHPDDSHFSGTITGHE